MAESIRVELGLASLSKQAVHQWETFENQPRIDAMAAWARAVGLYLDVGLREQGDERVQIAVAPDLVETIHRMHLLNEEDRAEIVRLVRRFSKE